MKHFTLAYFHDRTTRRNPMKTMLFSLYLSLLLVACAGGDVDPTGNWTTTLTWAAGDCGLSGSESPNITTVTRKSNGDYLITEADPGVTVQGSIDCDPSGCDISLSESGSGNLQDGRTFSANVSMNLYLDADGDIDGTGSVAYAFGDGSSCSQGFTIAGQQN